MKSPSDALNEMMAHREEWCSHWHLCQLAGAIGVGSSDVFKDLIDFVDGRW